MVIAVRGKPIFIYGGCTTGGTGLVYFTACPISKPLHCNSYTAEQQYSQAAQEQASKNYGLLQTNRGMPF
jgi:hypothetical protein